MGKEVSNKRTRQKEFIGLVERSFVTALRTARNVEWYASGRSVRARPDRRADLSGW